MKSIVLYAVLLGLTIVLVGCGAGKEPSETAEIVNYMKDHAEAGEVIFYDTASDCRMVSDLVLEQ